MCKVEKEKQNVLITENVEKFKPKIIWRNIIAFILMHSSAFYAVYRLVTVAHIPWYTFWFGMFGLFFGKFKLL